MADRDFKQELADCDPSWLIRHLKEDTFYSADLVAYAFDVAKKAIASPKPAPHAMTDEELLSKWRNTAAEHADGRGFDAAVVAYSRALLAQPAAVEPATVPQGWKLVPIEPTDEMRVPSYLSEINWPTRKQIYRDMISAAPSAAVAEPDRKAIDAQGAEECDHDFHYFGDQLVRRCNNCCAIEQASPLPAATLGKAALNEDQRQAIGEAINKFFSNVDNHDGTFAFDPYDANDVDLLIDTALDQQPATSDVRDASIEVPFLVEFSVSYLDGVMECENAEIQGKWKHIRDFIKKLQSTPAVQADEGMQSER